MKKLVISIAVSLVLFISVGGYWLYTFINSPSCTQLVKAPWYTVIIDIDSSTLPEGIQAEALASEQYASALQNTTIDPLYIVTTYSQGDEQYMKDYPLSEISSEYLPLFKLTDTALYYYVQPTDSDEGGWEQSTNTYTNENGPLIGMTAYILERMDNTFQNQYSDARPTDDPTVPQAHDVAIKGYYQDAPVTINGTAHYTLNPQYEQTIASKRNVNCQKKFVLFQFTDSVLTFLLYGLPIVLLDVVYALYRFAKKQKPLIVLFILPVVYILTVILFVSTAVFFA